MMMNAPFWIRDAIGDTRAFAAAKSFRPYTEMTRDGIRFSRPPIPSPTNTIAT